jgi:hypothetical protein
MTAGRAELQLKRNSAQGTSAGPADWWKRSCHAQRLQFLPIRRSVANWMTGWLENPGLGGGLKEPFRSRDLNTGRSGSRIILIEDEARGTAKN